jgi:tetratricopeptide (TPR) repeat protein
LNTPTKHRLTTAILAVFFFTLSTSAEAKSIPGHPDVKDSLEHVLTTATDTNRVIILNKLSFQYLLAGVNEKALLYSQQANELSRHLNYNRGLAKSLINSGNVFSATSDFFRAKTYYTDALVIAHELKDDIIISHCTNNLGEVFRHRGNFEKAIYYLLESLKICERQSDKLGKAETLNNIALVYEEMHNFTKAIEMYTSSLAVSRELKNQYDVSATLVNLGQVCLKAGERKRALALFEEALIIKRSIHNKAGEGFALLGIGNCYLEADASGKAMDYFKLALAAGKESGEKHIIGSSMNNIGTILSKRGEYQKSIPYTEEFLRISRETGAKTDQRDAYLNLAQTYNMLANYKKAFEYETLYSRLNDSIFNIESSRHIAEMQTRYESEQKEREIEVLKKEQGFQLLINRNQRIIFGSTVILFFLTGFVFYFRTQVSKQKNILLNQRVDAQNRELATVALLVSRKNKAFSQLKDKLEGFSLGNSETSSAKELIKDIDQEINFDDEWDTFKYHFEKVHPDFFARLKHMAPALSVTELRLCAYLRSNLTTKEIARLTNTTIRSVQQAKYRINQKFPESSGKLSDFIQTL